MQVHSFLKRSTLSLFVVASFIACSDQKTEAKLAGGRPQPNLFTLGGDKEEKTLETRWEGRREGQNRTDWGGWGGVWTREAKILPFYDFL